MAVLTFTGDFNEVDNMVRFQVLKVQNAPDTRESDPFHSIYITDPLEYDLTEYLGRTTVTTTTFAIVQHETLTQTNYGLLLTSNYTITYTTMNRMPAESSFLIQYPPTV